MALYIIQLISAGFQALIDQIKNIAQGEADLTKRITINSRDEFADLSNWVNTFIERLQNLIQNVLANANAIVVSIKEVSETSSIISQNTNSVSHQASKVTEATKQADDKISPYFLKI